MTWKRSDVAGNQLLYVSKLLRELVVDTDPKIMQKHAQQPINPSTFQPQRGINVFRKLHPQTAAAGILVLFVRAGNCAKYAALHEISDRSWSQHKEIDIKSQAMSVAERLCCDLNSWEEIRPTIPNAKPGRKSSSPLRLPSRDGTEKAQNTGVAHESGTTVSRSNAASPNFRTSPSAQPTQTRIKLKTNLCIAGETLSTHGALRLRSVLLPKD